MTLACDPEWLDTLLRTLGGSEDLRKQREASSSVSLACFGGVSSDLPHRALQVCNSTDRRRQIRLVTAFGEPLCSGGEPGGCGQGVALAGPVNTGAAGHEFGHRIATRLQRMRG